MRSGRGTRWLSMGLVLLVSLVAADARAHGPSIDVSFSKLRPKLLVIAAGDTVHFRRAGASQLSLTIVSDDGHFESPVLSAGGWHHTFETPGEFSFHLKENSTTRARIVVGERRLEVPEDEHAGHDH